MFFSNVSHKFKQDHLVGNKAKNKEAMMRFLCKFLMYKGGEREEDREHPQTETPPEQRYLSWTETPSGQRPRD